MERFIPYEKLSKKAQRERDKTRRVTWGPMNPVTRTKDSKKVYQRNKTRQWGDDPLNCRVLFLT